MEFQNRKNRKKTKHSDSYPQNFIIVSINSSKNIQYLKLNVKKIIKYIKQVRRNFMTNTKHFKT